MPVTLKLSDEEARDLAEMLSTAATVEGALKIPVKNVPSITEQPPI